MASLNKTLLIGNLTRAPEAKYLPSGTAIAEFGLAVNRKYTTDSGEKKEEVTFVEVVFYGKTAEIVVQYLSKGSQIFLEGRLHLEEWVDKATEQKRSRLRIIGESIQFLDRKPQETGEYQQPAASPPRQPAPAQRPAPPAQRQAAPAPTRPATRPPGRTVQYAPPPPDDGSNPFDDDILFT